MGKHLVSPHGTPIKGTKETIPGCAPIGTVRGIGDNGIVDFDYSTAGTELYWDDQQTVRQRDGGGVTRRVFLDEDGTEWLEHQLTLRDDADDQP